MLSIETNYERMGWQLASLNRTGVLTKPGKHTYSRRCTQLRQMLCILLAGATKTYTIYPRTISLPSPRKVTHRLKHMSFTQFSQVSGLPVSEGLGHRKNPHWRRERVGFAKVYETTCGLVAFNELIDGR